MDVDYVFAKNAIDELEKLLSDQKHGEREKIADEIIDFAEKMKRKWSGDTISKDEELFCTCGDDRDIGNAVDKDGIKYCMHCGYTVK